MTDAFELCGNPADEVYVMKDDFGVSPSPLTEPIVDELPFDIPRD